MRGVASRTRMGVAGAHTMNRPPRFAITSAAVRDGIARVGGAELHHMRDVMRLRVGDAVTMLDEAGVEYYGRIRGFETGNALVEIQNRVHHGRAFSLILGAAIIRGPRMDLMVEKAAEIGASEFWPLICARGRTDRPGIERIARWRRLAIAAAKQSLAPRPMEVAAPRNFDDLVAASSPERLAIICKAGAPPLARILREAGSRCLLIACGPEGDFDPAEIARAERAGFRFAGLGPNRLRSETAAIAALSIAAATLDEITQGA